MKFIKFLISKAFLLSILVSVLLSVVLVIGTIQFLDIYTNQDQRIEVPDLSALSMDDVKIVLEDANLRFEVLETGSYNPDIPKNTVLEQQPVAGEIVKEKRKIYLTINPDGYAETSIPEFYGRTKKEIDQLIINSGFLIGSYEEVDDIGTVVRGLKHKGDELEAGAMLPKMSKIDIVIGNGALR